MKRKLFLALLMLGFCGVSHAQVSYAGCPGSSTADVAYGREVLTISSTALSFTATKYADGGAPVKYAVVVLETNSIRATSDGLAPTASVGQLIDVTKHDWFIVCGQSNVNNFKAIRTTSDASITVQYFR